MKFSPHTLFLMDIINRPNVATRSLKWHFKWLSYTTCHIEQWLKSSSGCSKCKIHSREEYFSLQEVTHFISLAAHNIQTKKSNLEELTVRNQTVSCDCEHISRRWSDVMFSLLGGNGLSDITAAHTEYKSHLCFLKHCQSYTAGLAHGKAPQWAVPLYNTHSPNIAPTLLLLSLHVFESEESCGASSEETFPSSCDKWISSFNVE